MVSRTYLLIHGPIQLISLICEICQQSFKSDYQSYTYRSTVIALQADNLLQNRRMKIWSLTLLKKLMIIHFSLYLFRRVVARRNRFRLCGVLRETEGRIQEDFQIPH